MNTRAALTVCFVCLLFIVNGCSGFFQPAKSLVVDEKKPDLESLILIEDIDQDGIDEFIRFERNHEYKENPANFKQRILVENLFIGKIFDQINVRDWGRSYTRRPSPDSELHYGVISDHDGVFQIDEYDIDGNVVYSRSYGPFEDRNGDGVWQGGVGHLVSRDVNRDGIADPIYAVVAEYDKYPRFVSACDGTNGKELWRFELGMMVSKHRTLIADILGDGEDELILSNHANSNDVTVGQTSDMISQVAILSLQGELLRHYKYGGSYTTTNAVAAHDYDHDGEKELLILYSSNNQKRYERNRLFWLDVQTGSEEREILLEDGTTPNVGDAELIQDAAGNHTIVLGFRNKGIFTYNLDLELQRSYHLEELLSATPFVDPSAATGFKIVATTLSKDSKLMLLDDSLWVLAQGGDSEGFSEEKGYRSKVLLDRLNNSYRLVAESNGVWHRIRIEDKPWFTPQRIAWLLAGSSMCVSIVLVFLVFKDSRDRKTAKLMRQFSSFSNTSGAALLVTNQYNINFSMGDLGRFAGTSQVRKLEDLGSLNQVLSTLLDRLSSGKADRMKESLVVETEKGSLPVSIVARKLVSEKGDSQGYFVELAEQRQQQIHDVALENVAASQEVLHKIKTLISIYRSDLMLIKEVMHGKKTISSEVQREMFSDMESVSNTIEHLSRDYLNLTRLNQPELQTVDLNVLIRRIAEKVFKSKEEKVHLEYQLDGGITTFKADSGMLESLFLNLMENSADAVGQGGNIRIITRDVEEIQTKERVLIQKSILFEIQDDGEGLDLSDPMRVFEPGFTTKEAGVGMGLAVCKRIVSLHHGTIAFDSVKGKGSIITVKLPYL